LMSMPFIRPRFTPRRRWLRSRRTSSVATIRAERSRPRARKTLSSRATVRSLRGGLGLLGIECPEVM
jgi:hypothetical protein